MPKFNKLSDLFNHLQKNVIPDIMGKEVYEVVVEEESKNVEKYVYDEYSPAAYERRGRNRGLANPRNHTRTFVYSGVGQVKMLVENTTKGKDQTGLDLAKLVEYGHGNGYGEYQFPYSSYGEPTFLNPRRFTYYTILELKQSLRHVEAFKRGLARHNIKVK
ncbi:hypothetical protein [Oceanobacillus sp. FSL H7-0719]|uniref:hypothetical protein n=1 Tax=Oceanobacillus sp. FSL H7-0719 TaxID=2954507 RepID=UPI00324C7EED